VSLPAWVGDWVGLPYEDLGRGPVTFDCLGLFLALQREIMGRVIEDPNCTIGEAVRRRVVDEKRDEWQCVDKAEIGDAVLFRVGGRVLHVGFALTDFDMLHTDKDIGRSTVDRFRGAVWGPRCEGVFRYAAR